MTDVNEPDAVTEAALCEAADRAPQPTDYGFCAYGDAPPAIGGGIPWFYWFQDKQTQLTFLASHAVFLHPNHHIDVPAVSASVCETIRADAEDLEILRLKLNPLLKGVSQFTWIGSFAELCTGAHPFAIKVRSEFRELNGTPAGDASIKELEVEGFVDFLSSYGV